MTNRAREEAKFVIITGSYRDMSELQGVFGSCSVRLLQGTVSIKIVGEYDQEIP